MLQKLNLSRSGLALKSEHFLYQKSGRPPIMSSLLYLAALAGFALGAPQVQVGNTTLIGRDVTLLQQDFFGGERLP